MKTLPLTLAFVLVSITACTPTEQAVQPPVKSVETKAEIAKPAGELVLPTPDQAKTALINMLEMHDMQDQTSVKLGTCIAAEQAEHEGQVACTVSVVIGAGTSETQADFYRMNGEWKAQPSVSQDKLPFPDPKLD